MAYNDTLANLSQRLDDQIPYLAEIIGLIITWTVVLLLVRYFHKVIAALDQRSRHFELGDRALASFDKILDTFFYVMGVFVSLLILGITGALYAGLTAFGVIGLVIGFAGREVLSNILAGFVLIMESPFVIGDAIEVGGHSGTVRRLSLRSCQLQQFDGLYLTLPNSYLTSKPILNYTRNPLRRVEVALSLLHGADIPRALTLARGVMESLPERLEEQPVDVVVNNVEEAAVNLVGRFWVARTDFMKAKSAATMKLTQMCKAEGLELAVPLRKSV